MITFYLVSVHDNNTAHHENILAPILSFSQQWPVARLEMLSSQEIKCIIAMNFNCTMGD